MASRLKKFFVSAISAVFCCLPALVLAQTLQKPTNLNEFVTNFIVVLDKVIWFVSGFGFLGILTGLLKYVGAGGDEERLSKAKQLIAYGFFGVLIIFSFWGIVKLFAKTYLGV